MVAMIMTVFSAAMLLLSSAGAADDQVRVGVVGWFRDVCSRTRPMFGSD
jgi:hypothetical protein